MSKKISEKTVMLELKFDDGESDEVEISMQEYLTIEILAKSAGLTFEEKFVELLKESLMDSYNDNLL